MRDIWIAVLSTVVLLAVLLRIPPPEIKTIQLNEQDNGASIYLRAGQELVIKVQSLGGELATWRLVEADHNVLRWAEPEYREHVPIRMGGPVDVVWRFQALDPGETPIRLWLESLPETTPARVDRTFYVMVTVE